MEDENADDDFAALASSRVAAPATSGTSNTQVSLDATPATESSTTVITDAATTEEPAAVPEVVLEPAYSEPPTDTPQQGDAAAEEHNGEVDSDADVNDLIDDLTANIVC